jgi:1-aminocyclopropane-1-carboxylate deaminase
MIEINPFCRIDSLNAFCDFRATVDVLRLDLVHPVISGNKWFKLQVYLQEAKVQNKVLLTFGGAFSNHVVATAAAARSAGLKSIGIIRGERATVLSHTLVQAQAYGMKLCFTSRVLYKDKEIPAEIREEYNMEELYMVPEGGYGAKGMEGAKDILLKNNTGGYTHLIAAVGTGTTLAGLTAAVREGQKVVGISVLKNNFSLTEEINQLLPAGKQRCFELLKDYHFGGYARKTPELIRFMNGLYEKTGIPTDFVYTGKGFYATVDLLRKGYFTAGDKLLLVHTGGLQGNLSLPKGTLIFG